MKKYFISILFYVSANTLFAQQADLLLDSRYHHQLDRIDIKKPSDFTSVKPYNRTDVGLRIQDSLIDPLNAKYLLADNAFFLDSSQDALSKKPILKHIYRTKANFFEVKTNDFSLAINPVFDFGIGKSNGTSSRIFLNTRGIEIKGSVNDKIGFYSLLADNQGSFASYVYTSFQTTGAIAGENFWKSFKTSGFDFFTAKGYINFMATKNIRVKFGYDKNFIGDGYRSMILSDYAGNYTHLKIETKVWKLKYTNIFADLTADYTYSANGTSGANNFPSKFLSFHHLSINVRKNLNFGVFESIVTGGDSLGNGSLNINFMNPIIFYRAVESNIGSGGNAILGGNFKWNFLGHCSLYGQGVLDEFLLSHIKARDAWWANKYAAQLGFKYIDFANIKGLDLQIEANAARPFIYSHTYKRSSYSHFNQSLAHPLGANFNEVLGIIRLQPHKKLFLVAKYFYITQGRDQNGNNYGGNILLPNSSRIKRTNDIGHKQLQGNLTKINLMSLQARYMLKHNLFIDMEIYHRKISNATGLKKSENFIQLGLSLILASRLHEF